MFVSLIYKYVTRSWLRSMLTAMGVAVLVCVVTLIWSVLAFLDQATSEKSDNLKGIVTERWQIPSRMPFAYASSLAEGASREADDVRPLDSMTWQFYGGSTSKTDRTPENSLFAIAMEPAKLLTMMDELDSLPPAQLREFEPYVRRLESTRQGMIVGAGHLERMNKRIGDRFKIYSLNYRDIDLEFEIVGTFPRGRYDFSAAFDRDYLNSAVDAYFQATGRKHPMAQKSLNLVWLRVKDMEMFSKIAAQIESSPNYSSPAVKIETASSGISTFLDPYRDLIRGMRYLLAPAIFVVLALVIGNAISISVRERRAELAVMKVLGFTPVQLLMLVLGEAIVIGGAAGLFSGFATYAVINFGFGGITFPIAFFSKFVIPLAAIQWGLLIGLLAAFLGSLWPAFAAGSVRVSEVFSKVT